MYFSGGMASCTACMITLLPQVVDEGFGHDGAAGISCAEDQDPNWFTCHDGNVEKSRQRRSCHFAVLSYSMYAPRVKMAAALLDGLF